MFDKTKLDKKIDCIDEVDIASVKLPDLAIQFHSGCSNAKGFGPERKVEYRGGIVCSMGNMADDVWTDVAEAVVLRDLGADFLEKAMQFVRDHGTTQQTFSEASVRDAALSICTTEMFRGQNWEQLEEFEAAVPEAKALIAEASALH